MLLRCTYHMVNWYAAGVSQPLISYKCWDIYVPYQTDIIGETRGEIFCLFHCLEDTGFVFDDPRETGKESQLCLFCVYIFETYGEENQMFWSVDIQWVPVYELNHIALLDQLMYVNIENTRFALVNVGYVYFLWPFMNWRPGSFFFEKTIPYWIYLPLFV